MKRTQSGCYYGWLTGDRYTGSRPHATVDLVIEAPDVLADALQRQGWPLEARAVRDAAAAFASMQDADWYAGGIRLMEAAYLRGETPQAGSGFGGTAEDWRGNREMILDGVDRDGTFLDVGCANGLLMESVYRWAAERGLRVEPYGVDLGANLVAAARDRLPQWADRIEVGNAIDYVPAGGRRFTYVHVLLELVPPAHRAGLLRHALDVLVEPGGRLLVSRYAPAGGTDRADAADDVRALGFVVGGVAYGGTGGRAASTAWIERGPAS
ncbi:class I SAM-dependent methyltransferase [Dactylosporangium sp. CA-152071]|uniref:class I SAM-dependent methyltransferase n=1 Tax=Dactylosporangium sp. CA-152071 TaxID=3239933 RepID=UPI003D8A92EC